MVEYIWKLDWERISWISISISFFIGLITYLRSKKLERMKFYYKVKKEFYTKNVKEISGCITKQTLSLNETEGERPFLYYMKTNEIKKLTIDLLDTIDDLFMMYEDGLISKKLINHGFGRIILDTYENEKIKMYICKLRIVDKEPDYYIGLEKLYYVLKNYKPSYLSKVYSLLKRKYF